MHCIFYFQIYIQGIVKQRVLHIYNNALKICVLYVSPVDETTTSSYIS